MMLRSLVSWVCRNVHRNFIQVITIISILAILAYIFIPSCRHTWSHVDTVSQHRGDSGDTRVTLRHRDNVKVAENAVQYPYEDQEHEKEPTEEPMPEPPEPVIEEESNVKKEEPDVKKEEPDVKKEGSEAEHLEPVRDEEESVIMDEGGVVPVRKVLIAAYYRSGSSLAGEMFAASNDTFYVYEYSSPTLFQWYEAQYRIDKNLTIVEEPPASVADRPLYEEAILRPIHKIFQCDIESLEPTFLDNMFWKSKSSSWPMARFQRCFLAISFCPRVDLLGKCGPGITPFPDVLHSCHAALFGNLTFDPTLNPWNQSEWEGVVKPSIINNRKCKAKRFARLKECGQLLQEDCLKAPLRAMKEVRLDFRLVAPLLRMDPELRVIHLVRDPRGIMSSAWTNKINAVCERMIRDIRAFDVILAKYPGCCIRIKYEDLASKPEVVAARVYKHTGLHYDNYYGSWMAKINNPTNNTSSMGTYRVNMTAEAYDWKVKLHPSHITFITKQYPACAEVVRLLEYDKIQ